jgi:hypothetical protein
MILYFSYTVAAKDIQENIMKFNSPIISKNYERKKFYAAL